MLSLNATEFFEQREDLRRDFVARHVLGVQSVSLLAADWASRRYFRIEKAKGESFVLMEAIPDHTGAFTPGHKLSDFVRIAKALRRAGIHTPDILAEDQENGYVLLEDFGNVNMHDALRDGGDAAELYKQATDVLVSLRDRIDVKELSLPNYYDSHVHKGRQRIVDWYLPATRHAMNEDGLVQSYLAAWDEIEASLPPCPMGFVHGDYHAQNLMVLDKGLGVLDFQGAMVGPLPYDLANLVEDIRHDMPVSVRNEMIAHYSGGDVFNDWLRVMATQFHCRMAGQILRMAILGNRTEFLKFMPRVQAYLRGAIQDPLLKPLADWMRQEKIDLEASINDIDAIRQYIRPDAF